MSDLWLLWLIPAPIMLYFFVRFVQTRRAYVLDRPVLQSWTGTHVTFQITTRDCLPVVTEAARRIRQVCRELRYDNYAVEIVTDNPRAAVADADTIVIVPPTYVPPRGCKYKAKSLQYAIERRTRDAAVNGIDLTQRYIFLLDEESFVTTQTVRAVLDYLDQPAPPPISEGPITYPHGFFKVHPLCAVMECLRPYICYDCVALMREGQPTHLHGSNLLVRADVEAKIGWDHKGVDASEDQRFALEARLSFPGVKLFGWHGGVLEEQPAVKVRDAIRQRQRWFVGNVHNLIYCPIDWKLKVAVATRWTTWGFGFLAGLASFAAFVIPQDVPLGLRLPLFLNTILWLVGYQVGAYFNFQPYEFSLPRRVVLHLAVLVLSPFAGLVDSWSAFTAPLHIWHFDRVPTPKMTAIALGARP